MPYISVVGSFDDLVDAIKNLPLKDQKDIAEDILCRLEQNGYECNWFNPDLSATKTEQL